MGKIFNYLKNHNSFENEFEFSSNEKSSNYKSLLMENIDFNEDFSPIIANLDNLNDITLQNLEKQLQKEKNYRKLSPDDRNIFHLDNPNCTFERSKDYVCLTRSIVYKTFGKIILTKIENKFGGIAILN